MEPAAARKIPPPTCLAHRRQPISVQKHFHEKPQHLSFLPLDRAMDRKPYAGSTPKLVLAYDVGTTFSGAAYW